MKLSAKKIAFLSLLTGLGLVSFLLESAFPSPIAGVKLGISNLFSLFALVFAGFRSALIVTLSRTLLGSLFAGNPSMLLYSLTAGIASVTLSRVLLVFRKKISFVAVSVAAAVSHNTVQLFVYSLLSGISLRGYLPFLALFGGFAGAFVGLSFVFALKLLSRAREFRAFKERVAA